MKRKTDRKERVQYRKAGRVAYITLNRPSVLNALDRRTHEELASIWDDFECDDEIWLGVLTGAGEKSFSVGQDLKELASTRDSMEAYSTIGSEGRAGWPRLTERFSFTKPLIARVNGYALGGGFELALSCDLIIAAEHAVFGLPEAKLGLIAGAGGVFRLARQMPHRTAMGYLMTGRRMTAKRGFELGLVNEVAANGKLDEVVNCWVEDILRCAPLSVKAIKEVATKSAHMSLEQAFNTRYFWESKRSCSLDRSEGIKAFIEKRIPRWLGQ